jgi:hypothetical protein
LLRAGDELFVAGEKSCNAYMIGTGGMKYAQDPFTSPTLMARTTDVVCGSWLSEAALWSQWLHVGTATQEQSGEAIVVNAHEIPDASYCSVNVTAVTREYCIQFHRRLISATPPHTEWPSDVEVPFTDYGDIVAGMEPGIRGIIGRNALEHAERRSFFAASRSNWAKLRDEVNQEKCTVVINGKDELERIVSLVALHVEDGDCLLVQIGKLEGSGWMPCCQLPGGKFKQGELTADVVERLISEKLSPLTDRVKLVGTERHVEWNNSKDFGVRTKYFRTVCVLHVTEPIYTMNARRKSASHGSSPGASPLVAELLSREVFVFDEATGAMINAKSTPSVQWSKSRSSVTTSSKSKSGLFCWIRAGQFEQLRANTPLIEEWLRSLEDDGDPEDGPGDETPY